MIREPTFDEIPELAQLWYDGWQTAHRAHVPTELTKIRTLESFKTRLASDIDAIRIYDNNPTILGLCMVKGCEIYQIFVSPAAQGKGVASALITDGETRIKQAGYKQAKLDVIPQNKRAIAFYEKMGWQKRGVETIMLDTLDEPFPLPCLVMVKNL